MTKKLIMNHGNKLELFFSLRPRSHCQLMFAELWVWSLWGRRATSLQAVISCVLSLSVLISCPLLACEISVAFLFVATADLMWVCEYCLVFKDTIYQLEAQGCQRQKQASALLKPCVTSLMFWNLSVPQTPPNKHLQKHTHTLRWPCIEWICKICKIML